MPDMCDTMLLEMQMLRREEADRQRYEFAVAQLTYAGIVFDEDEVDPVDLWEEIEAEADRFADEEKLLN